MPRPRRGFTFWGIAAIMALFTLLGLVFIAVGPDVEARLTGLMCVLFFGAIGVATAADAFAGEGEDVVAAIERYRDEPDRRRAIGSEQEHARLLRELGEA